MDLIKAYLLILIVFSGLLVSQTTPTEDVRLSDFVHVTPHKQLRVVSRRFDEHRNQNYPPSPRPGRTMSTIVGDPPPI